MLGQVKPKSESDFSWQLSQHPDHFLIMRERIAFSESELFDTNGGVGTQQHCTNLGQIVGQTDCQCGSGTKQIDVHECRARHGLDVMVPDGAMRNVCQLANHQRPHSGRWPLPRLPSCSTCEHSIDGVAATGRA